MTMQVMAAHLQAAAISSASSTAIPVMSFFCFCFFFERESRKFFFFLEKRSKKKTKLAAPSFFRIILASLWQIGEQDGIAEGAGDEDRDRQARRCLFRGSREWPQLDFGHFDEKERVFFFFRRLRFFLDLSAHTVFETPDFFLSLGSSESSRPKSLSFVETVSEFEAFNSERSTDNSVF